jgi:hypothetical protein
MYRYECTNEGHINEDHVIRDASGGIFCAGFKSEAAAKHTLNLLNHGAPFVERRDAAGKPIVPFHLPSAY